MANFNHSSYRIERIYLNYSAPYNLKWMIFDVSSNGFGVHEAMLWLQDCAHYRLHMKNVTSQGSNTILSCISRRDLGLCVSSHLLLLLVGEDRKVCISVSWLLALGASTCGSTSGTSSTWQSSLKPITWHTNTLHVTHTLHRMNCSGLWVEASTLTTSLLIWWYASSSNLCLTPVRDSCL